MSAKAFNWKDILCSKGTNGDGTYSQIFFLEEGGPKRVARYGPAAEFLLDCLHSCGELSGLLKKDKSLDTRKFWVRMKEKPGSKLLDSIFDALQKREGLDEVGDFDKKVKELAGKRSSPTYDVTAMYFLFMSAIKLASPSYSGGNKRYINTVLQSAFKTWTVEAALL